MNRATIKRVIQSQGYTPSFRTINEHNTRVFVLVGRSGGRAVGYLHQIESMTERQFIGCIKAAFRRKAR